MELLYLKTVTNSTDLVEEMVRKRLYFLKCCNCSESATREVWFSDNTADFTHMCEVHWEKFKVSGIYVSVYKLRS